jgi:DNA-binding MarR family transcriptional regulator
MRASNPSGDSLAHRLIAAIMPLMKGSQAEVMAATAQFDLTLTQLRMMFVLEKAGQDLAVSELAESVVLSVAAAGRAANAMVRVGLLSRREDEIDRRIKRIALTAAGHRAIVKIGLARSRAVATFVNKLDAQERVALDAAVATLGALTSTHIPLPGLAHAVPPTETKSSRKRSE